MNKKEFITAVAGYVDKYASAYGILVHSSVIAQEILESGWGKSTLAAKYHNYFGLKCGTKWKGGSVNLSTKEEYTPRNTDVNPGQFPYLFFDGRRSKGIFRIYPAFQISEPERHYGSKEVPGNYQGRRFCDQF